MNKKYEVDVFVDVVLEGKLKRYLGKPLILTISEIEEYRNNLVEVMDEGRALWLDLGDDDYCIIGPELLRGGVLTLVKRCEADDHE